MLHAGATVTARTSSEGFLEIALSGAPRKEPERNGDRGDCGQSEQQNRHVDGDTLLPWQIRRKNCWKCPDYPSGYQDAQYASNEGKPERLGEKLLNQTAAPGAECCTHRQFLAAGGCARYQ